MNFEFKIGMRYPGEFSEWLSHDEDEDQQILVIHVTSESGEKIGHAYFGYLTESRGGELSCL